MYFFIEANSNYIIIDENYFVTIVLHVIAWRVPNKYTESYFCNKNN